jgi:hypothetical protein
MGISAEKTKSGGWLAAMIGTVLLAVGLLALGFPVFLDEYDKYGIQVKCANGYSSQLLQATVDDQTPGGQPAPGAVEPATNHVDQCKSAVAHRRAWAVPTVGLGALLLVAKVTTWARTRTRAPGSPADADAWSVREEDMHEAARLDREQHSHWGRPTNTTL